MATQEMPVLEAQTGIDTVTFGKYNYQRVPMLTRADDRLRDAWPTSRQGSTDLRQQPDVQHRVLGRCAAKELHGLDYRVGGGDFKLHGQRPLREPGRTC